jgi:hypothetical protein
MKDSIIAGRKKAGTDDRKESWFGILSGSRYWIVLLYIGPYDILKVTKTAQSYGGR